MNSFKVDKLSNNLEKRAFMCLFQTRSTSGGPLMRDHFLYVVLRRKTLIRAELHEDSSLNRHNGSLSDEPCGTLPSAI